MADSTLSEFTSRSQQSKAYRRLAAAVIRDAFQTLIKRAPQTLPYEATAEWFFSPDSNLFLWAGLLGHTSDYYAKKAHKLITCMERIEEENREGFKTDLSRAERLAECMRARR